jgi:hypothetical protein
MSNQLEQGEVIASVVVTPSTHLADFMATCGCQIQQTVSGPERTPQQTPVVKWVFQASPKAEEIMVLWKNPPQDTRDWDELTQDEKKIVINFVTAFSDNLHHFIKRAKEG